MDDKTIIDITNLDAEKHAENAAKRVASYSEKLLHHASILSEKEYQKFLLERLEKDNGYVVRKASDFDRYFAVDREMHWQHILRQGHVREAEQLPVQEVRQQRLPWHWLNFALIP